MLWLAGCADKSTFPVRTYPMGEKVTLGHLVYTVLETQWLTHLGDVETGRVPQGRFLLVRVVVTDSGGDPVVAPNLSVEDDSGHGYPELMNGEGVPEWAGYLRQIKPAESSSGNLVFDVSPKHYKLRILDEDGQRAALIDLPLNFPSETPELPVGEGQK